jgi:predicted DCC family thiol-disulfide oxidoreductase YuxK
MLPESCLIYDGDCPFCSRYVRLLRLRQAVGEIELIDARSNSSVVEAVKSMGYNLNDGMVLKLGERIYHGADCINRLALLSTPVNLFNRCNARLFANPRAAKLLYPCLRAGRNLILQLRGKPRL